MTTENIVVLAVVLLNAVAIPGLFATWIYEDIVETIRENREHGHTDDDPGYIS